MRSYSKSSLIANKRRILLVCMLFIIFLVTIVLFSVKAKASTSTETYKYYTSYEVKKGDSLWSIANTYSQNGYNSNEAYVKEIKQINHLLDDDITEGETLVITYYSTVIQ